MNFTSISVVEVGDKFGAKVNGELIRDIQGDPRLFGTAQEAGEAAEKLAGLNTPARTTPNPNSTLLASAIIGGCGIGPTPPSVQPPNGMASILLYVPMESIAGKTLPELQNDIGLPWSVVDAEGVCTGAWFDELKT